VKIDRLGLLNGFGNCSADEQFDIQQGEQRLNDFLEALLRCSNSDKCIDPDLAKKVLDKLKTNTVECSDWDRITTGGIWGASAPAPGSSINFHPEMFRHPGNYRCFAATLLHESLHSIGILHSGSGGFDPDDPVYGAQERCVRAGLCAGEGR
jgi:hypothetical protein